MSDKKARQFMMAMKMVGGLFGLWALAALAGGLRSVNWHATEFIRQGLVASGLVKPIHTFVDYYTHIKGIEYLICVAFFVVFPLFYSYLAKSKPKTTVTKAIRK